MKFRKKPIIIEAFQWWVPEVQTNNPLWFVELIKAGRVTFPFEGTPDVQMRIETLKGPITASQGDWIIKGIKGELYPRKPEIFEATYELVQSHE